ncbi:serine/threonine-protein kinase [Ideonella livida]|uniref:Serine/threonine protein kinase n=1 Tax=Ideonella livida TaxID=2707176 RepID=A0A7C9PKZ2_9BURK|nr:serine/threonine-protein kinase [Ideonella livida]NDY94052.1 serine/threonine protein kinase [Ideonella livida]
MSLPAPLVPHDPPSGAAPSRPDWAAVKALFELALAQPVERRRDWLARATAPAAVREEVQSLLDQPAPEDTLHRLSRPLTPISLAAVLQAREEAEPPLPPPGTRLGPWEVTGLLGRGGMADVLAARRADGAWDGPAAVKVLRAGQDSAAVLERFAQEQQALGRLVHPHIARLLDAGRTPAGQPYFVMERVEGRPLDEACRGLPLPARLALFLQLADAVAFAHRQLLVHRDLKPSNVLVTAEGQVKLLDFGIAKALDPTAGPLAQADLTQAGQRPFTPYWASPEQVRGDWVGLPSDVYGLGLLLYVMLTGVRPYGRQAEGTAEVLQAVLHEPPSRASHLPPHEVPDPSWLRRRSRLAGDLDKILATALAKVPEDRYPSVEALAADVRAHLDGRPVSVRTARPLYLAHKFVRRHPAGVGLSALAGLALVAALGGLGWQARQAELARHQAEERLTQVRQLANRLVFQYHDQAAAMPGALALREALLRDAIAYLDALARQGAGAPDPVLASELAQSYQRIAVLQGESFSPSQERSATALQSTDKALDWLARAPQDLPTQLAGADLGLLRAQLLLRQGRLQAGQEALHQTLPWLTRAERLAPQDPQVRSRRATWLGRHAMLLAHPSQASLGQVDAALRRWDEALPLFERLRREQPEQAEWTHQLAWAHAGRMAVLSLDGQDQMALEESERMLALREAAARAFPDNPHFQQQVSAAQVNRAVALGLAGRWAQARPWFERADARYGHALADDPGNQALRRDAALLQLTRARALARSGQEAAARPLLRAAVAALDGLQAEPGDFYLARWRAEVRLWAARTHRAQDPAQALRWADEALAQVDQAADAANANARWMRAQALGEQAAALAVLGRAVPAAERARQARQLWHEGVPRSLSPWAEQARALLDARTPLQAVRAGTGGRLL